jgi:hypothetical protein
MPTRLLVLASVGHSLQSHLRFFCVAFLR